MASTQQPSYRAFTVIKREGQDDYWLPIGAAFMHQDGDGYNIVLQALPIDGRVVLRLPKSEDETAPDGSPRIVAGTDQRGSSPRRR